MASASPPSSPPSASNSQNSATHPISYTLPKPQGFVILKVDAAINNGTPHLLDKRPDILEAFQDLDSPDYLEKYKKYEADFVRRLLAKYFSKNNLYGGNIFDEKMAIDDEIIKSSRWPCTRSYADPLKGFEDQNITGSTSMSETPTNISNGK